MLIYYATIILIIFMAKYDLCGEVTNKNDIHIFQEFPRYID